MSTRRRSKRILITLIVASILGVAGMMMRLSPASFLLTKRATRVMALPLLAKIWHGPPSIRGFIGCFLVMWAMAGCPTMRLLCPTYLDPSERLTKLDIHTGRRTVLSALDHQVGNDWVGEDLSTSPDGTHVLWGTSSGETSASLDGSSFTKRESRLGFNISGPIWLRDSKQWVRLALKGGPGITAIVESVNSSHITHEISIGFPKGTYNHWDEVPVRLLGCLPSGRILATPDSRGFIPKGSQREINFFEFSVDGGPAHVRQYTINLFNAGEGSSMTLPWRGTKRS